MIRDFKGDVLIDTMECGICYEMVDPRHAVETTCRCKYVICITCSSRLKKDNDDTECIWCKKYTSTKGITSEDEKVVNCPKCDWIGKFADFKNHSKSCSGNHCKCRCCPFKGTFNDVSNHAKSHSDMYKRKLHNSPPPIKRKIKKEHMFFRVIPFSLD